MDFEPIGSEVSFIQVSKIIQYFNFFFLFQGEDEQEQEEEDESSVRQEVSMKIFLCEFQSSRWFFYLQVYDIQGLGVEHKRDDEQGVEFAERMVHELQLERDHNVEYRVSTISVIQIMKNI